MIMVIKRVCLLILILIFLIKINVFAKNSEITYLESINEDEEGEKLYFPFYIFIDTVRKEIYVVDAKARIIIYTPDLFPIFTLSKAQGVETPQGLTVDADGNLYVVQTPTRENPKYRISVFNASLRWEKDIYLDNFKDADKFIPYNVAIDKKGNILVAGRYYPGVLIIDADGNILDIISPVEEEKKVNVNYVTVDKNGNIYMVSEEEGRIYVYDENKKFILKFGTKGGSSGKLSRPQAVAEDSKNGNMYVVDYMRHTISAYDKDGKYLFEFGGLGWGEGWFQYPKCIAVDDIGRIFIVDTFNHRIQVFKLKE